jgi:hypothetical protein
VVSTDSAIGHPNPVPRVVGKIRPSVKSKEREYRAYAGTCVDLANKAANDEDKKHLLAMAEAWLGLADRV